MRRTVLPHISVRPTPRGFSVITDWLQALFSSTQQKCRSGTVQLSCRTLDIILRVRIRSSFALIHEHTFECSTLNRSASGKLDSTYKWITILDSLSIPAAALSSSCRLSKRRGTNRVTFCLHLLINHHYHYQSIPFHCCDCHLLGSTTNSSLASTYLCLARAVTIRLRKCHLVLTPSLFRQWITASSAACRCLWLRW